LQSNIPAEIAERRSRVETTVSDTLSSLHQVQAEVAGHSSVPPHIIWRFRAGHTLANGWGRTRMTICPFRTTATVFTGCTGIDPRVALCQGYGPLEGWPYHSARRMLNWIFRRNAARYYVDGGSTIRGMTCRFTSSSMTGLTRVWPRSGVGIVHCRRAAACHRRGSQSGRARSSRAFSRSRFDVAIKLISGPGMPAFFSPDEVEFFNLELADTMWSITGIANSRANPWLPLRTSRRPASKHCRTEINSPVTDSGDVGASLTA